MAEWLTHVLLMYAVGTAATWHHRWFDSRWVAVGMIGAILPDLSRFYLIVPDETITQITGLPFAWNGLHTLAGILLLSGIGGMVFTRTIDQRRGFAVLLAGALFHIVVDIPQTYADGLTITNLYFYPFSSWRGITPGWYVPADRWVVLISAVAAILVWMVDRYLTNRPASQPD